MLIMGVSPAYALFCGSAIISEGDPKHDVLRKCGEPVAVEEEIVYETIYLDPYGQPEHRVSRRKDFPHPLQGVPIGPRIVTVPVRVEIWTYNFGPHRLMYRLHMVEGVLRDIRTLGYGY
jgi:hypothetical protein